MRHDEMFDRLSAHRLAFLALALAMDEAKPGAFENTISVLGHLENKARELEEPPAYLEELQLIRATLKAKGDLDWQDKTERVGEFN